MLKYLQKEASCDAIIGPFSSCPFLDGMVISPLNTVPKSNPNERRIILDLSFPKDGTGVNDFVSKDEYLGSDVELVYPKIDDFVSLIKAKGQGCLMFKLDLRRAYRQISICPSSYNLVGFKWKKHIFFDTVLSMGLRSSAHICQRVTNAFAFMMFKFGFCICNYLDDFCGVEKNDVAHFAFMLLREIFVRSGIEEALDKACPPSDIMVFLGVLFNSSTMTMEVTQERLAEIKSLVSSWLGKESVTLKEIQSLLGKLNFVGACVRSSRIFVNRILNWFRECHACSSNKFLVTNDVKKDLLWWHKFLSIFQGKSLIDYGEWSLVDSVFSCDSCLTGCGGICGNSFFHSVFPGFILNQNLSITCLEMLTVIVSLKLWCAVLRKKKVVIYCDNQAVCIVINTGKTRSLFLQKCLRELCFITSVNEIQIKAIHLSSDENRIADCLSRWDLDPMYINAFYEQVSHVSLLENVAVPEDIFRFLHDW